MKPLRRGLNLGLVLLLVATGFTADLLAQTRDNTFPRSSPNATVTQTVGVTEVTITYGRPSVNGRTIFGELVPLDQVWRTGANEATTITFSTDVKIEGQDLAAGTYALFSIPGSADDLTFIFNKEADQWGAFNYKEAEDALRVTVPSGESSFHEQFTIAFHNVTEDAAQVVGYWENGKAGFKIEVDTEAIVMAQGVEAVAQADTWQVPLQYARYANQHGHHEEARAWLDKSIEIQPTYLNLSSKARALAENGDVKEAIAYGDRALEQAKAMSQAPRGLEQFERMMEEWRAKQ